MKKATEDSTNWAKISAISAAIQTGLRLITSILVIVGLFVAYGQLVASLESAKLDRRMRTLQIESDLRSRWIEWHRDVLPLDHYRYPENGRKYTEHERRRIRAYWETIMMNEFAIIYEFQDGLLRDEWPRFELYIIDAMQSPAQAEEWAYFVETRNQDYIGDFKAEVQRIVRKSVPEYDAEALLDQRQQNTIAP